MFLLRLLLCCLPWLSNAAIAQSLPEAEIGELRNMALRAPVEYAATQQDLDLEQARRLSFSPLRSADLNQGVTGKRYWLRFALRNDSDSRVDWILHPDNAYLDRLNVYYRDRRAGTAVPEFSLRHLSDREPFSARPLPYRRLAFEHSTAAGGVTEVYLEAAFLQADTMSLNFRLSEREVFLEQVQLQNFVLGLYYGVLLLLLTLALMVAILLKQLSALYYAAFMLSTMAMWSLLNGVSFQYLWPDGVYWQNQGFHIAFLLFSLCAFQFSKEFLKTSLHVPRAHRWMNAAQLLMLVAVVLRLAGVHTLVLWLSYLALAASMLLPVVGALVWRRGLGYARWYTLAWLVYSATLLLALLSASTPFFSWGIDNPLILAQAGSVVEAVLLLLAIGEGVIQVDRAHRQTTEMAHRDPVTGLGNRRFLVRFYDNLRSVFRPGKSSVFVILMDLDHFKQINDVYGHQAGDCVLQDLASLLRRSSRPEDACIRYGGDEFLMVVQVEDQEAALQVAERIRNQFAEEPTVFRGHLIRHTISIGLITALDPERSMSAPEVLERVDEALYQAKKQGRNQTVAPRA